MENSIYSSMGNRRNKTFQDKRESDLFTLKDFLESKWIIQNKIELKAVVMRELKILLLKENVFELIQCFFDLESQLQLVQEKLQLEEEFFPFEDFYKNLSPIILRSLLDISHQHNVDSVLNSIKESIRIAIEEEIYQFGEKYES